MHINTWPRKKKITLSILLAAVLVVCGTCVVVLLQNQKRTLFHIDRSQVRAVTLSYSSTSVEITDEQQVDEIVKLLNGFAYAKSVELPDDLLFGPCYHLELKTYPEWKKLSFAFGSNYIRAYNKGGGTTGYSGPDGYFQTLVDLVDEAHARFLTEE